MFYINDANSSRTRSRLHLQQHQQQQPLSEYDPQIQKMRKFELALAFTSSQILILFPLFICAKLYIYDELHWSWLVIIPQLSAIMWLILVPFCRLRLLGFLLLSVPAFVALGLRQPSTYWGCHAALFPFFLSLFTKRKIPLGFIVSAQLHLEVFLAVFDKVDLINFPQIPTVMGVLTFFVLFFGTVLLPLADLSVAFLLQQLTRPVLAVTLGWTLLCLLLSLHAVGQYIHIPFYVYASILMWIGVAVTLDALMVFVSWRTRLVGPVWPYITEPIPAPPPQLQTRSLRSRGLTSAEMRELPLTTMGKRTENCDGICTICQDQVEEGRPVVLLPACHHVFHPECVTLWLRRKPNCPNCQRSVRNEETGSPVRGARATDGSNSGRSPTNRNGAPTRLSTMMRFITRRTHQRLIGRYAADGLVQQQRLSNRNTVPLLHARRQLSRPTTPTATTSRTVRSESESVAAEMNNVTSSSSTMDTVGGTDRSSVEGGRTIGRALGVNTSGLGHAKSQSGGLGQEESRSESQSAAHSGTAGSSCDSFIVTITPNSSESPVEQNVIGTDPIIIQRRQTDGTLGTQAPVPITLGRAWDSRSLAARALVSPHTQNGGQ